ncbi:hypothetical protein JOC77_003388 [Peribacillus deserti]|uniref:YtkA-like domain-containing protein n=1 Tax=Peribacillus deserti TaxID=673318 RepID=A0ABS2QMG5_9BACI|nr:FixH family protein [Peribacillus deserti]MBM7693944.1 hypothetical protein [Peribacillus deserti]
MKKIAFLLFSAIFLLGACTNNGPKNSDKDKNKIPEILSVELSVQEKAEINEEVKLAAKVTQGNETVEDADEVKFEIRKSGGTDYEMIEVKKQSHGVYSINKKFQESGTYTVISHVTARDMHSMPSKQITIGSPASDPDEHSHSEGNEESHGHHHEGNVSIKFLSPETVKVNKEVQFTAHIQNENQPLEHANVRFEIWKANEEKHEFLNSIETGTGEYSLNKTFAAADTYEVVVHVEKGDIHTHKQQKIVVK